MQKHGFKQLREQVLWCLENRKQTRDCHRLLWLSVCKNFHRKNFIKYIMECALMMDVEVVRDSDVITAQSGHWKDLPDTESIRRTMQKVQNEEGMFPPLDPEVLKKRRQNEEVWKKELGYRKDLN